MPRHYADPQRLVRSTPVVVAGRSLICEQYSHPTRRTGCRVILRDPDSKLLVYDTDNCYDAANAENKVHLWEADQLKATNNPDPIAQGHEMVCSMSQSDIDLSREQLGMRPKAAEVPAECPF